MGIVQKVIKQIWDKDYNKIPDTHKVCPDCEGTGYEEAFISCQTCNHQGMVKKSYQDYVNSLTPRDDVT